MFTPVQSNTTAWQPLTPRGVAAFAGASWRRLWLVQCLVALAAAAVLLWILTDHWFPGIRSAIRRLPEQGRIYRGRLEWSGSSRQWLADGNFLAISVDLDHSGTLRSPAHLQLEFGRTDLQLHSLLGYYVSCPYPQDCNLPFNRPALEPWWGAWSPILLGAAALISVTGLMLCWSVLATLYAPIVWLIGLYGNRELGLQQSWKMAGAALMPGAVLEIAALAGYGLARLDLVPLLAATAVHFVVPWIYLFLGRLFLQRTTSPKAIKGNPFAADPTARADEDPKQRPSPR